MLAVVFTGAGGNEVVRVEERSDPVPGSEDVLVRVRYAGVNPADTAQRAGHYPAPPGCPADVPGLEVAGTVASCGAEVRDWRPGDRVFGLVGGGGLAGLVSVHERCATRIPDALSEREAAAVPEAFVTAHDAIASQCGLRPGETLLVHGAGGGVGTAAVQIGLAAGARVLGSVRSRPAGAAVEALGAETVPDEGFADAVLELTGGRGADVVLELVGASHFPDNLRALAAGGRLAVVGVASGRAVSLDLLALMRKRATLRGTVLRARSLEEKALAVRAFEREVVPHLASGRLHPLVDSVFPLDRVAAAFDRLDGPGKVGKVLLELP
ncbi:MAG: zinc-binding dehydrogenase [Thermoleophilia bacterium]|nr:zinc-binding dehydrogenase [Thermoleophilia bacterium]